MAPAVDTLRTEAGLSAKDACEIVGISRSRYYAVKTPVQPAPSTTAQRRKEAADQVLLERMQAICGDHPFWGAIAVSGPGCAFGSITR